METACGSHTHTLVPERRNVYIYVSSYSPNAAYPDCQPPHDGISVIKVGPKDAVVEVVGLPLVAVPYFRVAMRGMFQAACELVCRRAYVQEVHRKGAANAGLRIAWA